MRREFHPVKLERAARAFGAEGKTHLAKDLARKASQIRKQAAAIPDLVERARAGDQNALGMITAVRDQADAGHARAVITCQLVEKYCTKNPPEPQPGDDMLAAGVQE